MTSWFYKSSNKAIGPVNLEALKAAIVKNKNNSNFKIKLEYLNSWYSPLEINCFADKRFALNNETVAEFMEVRNYAVLVGFNEFSEDSKESTNKYSSLGINQRLKLLKVEVEAQLGMPDNKLGAISVILKQAKVKLVTKPKSLKVDFSSLRKAASKASISHNDKGEEDILSFKSKIRHFIEQGL